MKHSVTESQRIMCHETDMSTSFLNTHSGQTSVFTHASSSVLSVPRRNQLQTARPSLSSVRPLHQHELPCELHSSATTNHSLRASSSKRSWLRRLPSLCYPSQPSPFQLWLLHQPL